MPEDNTKEQIENKPKEFVEDVKGPEGQTKEEAETKAVELAEEGKMKAEEAVDQGKKAAQDKAKDLAKDLIDKLKGGSPPEAPSAGRSPKGGKPAPPDKPASRHDPHLGFKFWVEIDGIEIAGFSECAGLSIETEVLEYAEGGWNDYIHKLPVRTKYSNVTLRRGINDQKDLFEWYTKNINSEKRKRANVTISVYTQKGELGKQWVLRDAFPVKWVGPDLKTDAAAVAVESVEFAHHGLQSMPDRK